MTLPPLSRRTLLQAAGVGLALPFLDAMRPLAAADPKTAAADPLTAATAPARALFVYVSNGVTNEGWYPKATGRDFQLAPSMAPLADFRDQLTVISGLSHYKCDTGAHTGGDCWLTGQNPNAGGRGYQNGISIDQLLADKLGEATRLPSLQVGRVSGAGGPNNTATVAFDRRGTPLPCESSAKELFQRLFIADSQDAIERQEARLIQRRSIMDELLGQMKQLDGQLGAADRARLDDYLTAVRTAEKQLERDRSWLRKPKPAVAKEDAPAEATGMPALYQILFLAFRADLTRIATCNEGTEQDSPRHQYSHHGGREENLTLMADLDRESLGHLAGFLKSLQDAKEGDGTMLDRTMVLYGSSLNNGHDFISGTSDTHSHTKLPLLLAGGRGLGIKTGQHLLFPDDATPMSNLFVSMQAAMGFAPEPFKQGKAPLTGLM